MFISLNGVRSMVNSIWEVSDGFELGQPPMIQSFDSVQSYNSLVSGLGDLTVEQTEDLKEGLRGTYSFLSNKVKVSGDDPVAEVHEKTHAENIEALLEDSEAVREKAVGAQNLPESYVEMLDGLGVAEADYSLASGITFQRFEERYGFDISNKGPLVKSIFSSGTEKIMEEVVDEFGLDNFDVRDEAFAQTVDAYQEGLLDSPEFSDKMERVRESYNDFMGYRENAGDMIAQEMESLKEAYRSAGNNIEGLIGIRPDYLRGDF